MNDSTLSPSSIVRQPIISVSPELGTKDRSEQPREGIFSKTFLTIMFSKFSSHEISKLVPVVLNVLLLNLFKEKFLGQKNHL